MNRAPKPEYQLYLYRLFADEIGLGKQSFLPHVEEVLTKDGLSATDFGFKTTHDLLQALESFTDITTFKGGRIYVRFCKNDHFDECLAALAQGATQKKESTAAKKTGRPWKNKKTSLKPLRPLTVPPKKTDSTIKTDSAELSSDKNSDQAKTETHSAELLDEAKPRSAELLAEAKPHSAELLAETEAIKPLPLPYTINPIVEANPKAQTRTSELKAEATAQPALAFGAETTAQPAPTPREEKTSTHTQAKTSARKKLPENLPIDFLSAVSCHSKELAELSNLLPFDSNLQEILSQDWQLARATGNIDATRSEATFSLRYLNRTNEEPIKITISHIIQSRSSKKWRLTKISAGSIPDPTQERDFFEARLINEGTWCALSAEELPDEKRKSPLRAMCTQLCFHTLSDLIEELSNRISATYLPLSRKASQSSSLLEYLSLGFARLTEQNRFLKNAKKDLAVWNTGLTTNDYDPIYLLFKSTENKPNESSAPWTFWRLLCGEDSKTYLKEYFGTLPKAATYLDNCRLPLLDNSLLDTLIAQLESKEEIRLRMAKALSTSSSNDVSKADVGFVFQNIDTKILIRSLKFAKTDWRVVAPVFDPQDSTLKYLLPYREGALLLSKAYEDNKNAGNILQMDALISLDVAYSCAKLISPSQPSWLCAHLRKNTI